LNYPDPYEMPCEWTMSREGMSGSYEDYIAWDIDLVEGYPGCSGFVDGSAVVRPVFYLTSSQRISGGTGSLSNPYYLS